MIWFLLGLTSGDPHFKTLDGLDYTYNGIGEYTLLASYNRTNDDKTFELQTRTLQAKDKNGTLIAATIFGGFAAKELFEDGGSCEVEMNTERNGKLN